MNRDFYEPDHEAFREIVQAYIKREVAPNEQRWEEERSVDRQAWLAAGGADWDGAEKWEKANALMAPVFGSADAQEGARAFAEKRPPVWKGQ